MGIYLALPPIVLILGIITKTTIRQFDSRKIFLFSTYLILFLIMGLRGYNVGVDNWNYINLFYKIGQAPFIEAITKVIPSAPIYCLYNKLLYLICPHAVFFSLCNALVACICTGIFFYHFSKNVVFSVYCHITVYLYLSSFNMTRQYLAISLILLTTCLIDDNKILKAIIVYVLAVGIHNTAFIMLPIILLIRLKITPNRAISFAVSFIIFSLCADLLFEPFIKIFTQIFPQYQWYLGGYNPLVFDSGRGDNFYLKIFYLFFIIIAYYMVVKNRNNLHPIPNEVSKLLLIVSIGLVLGLSDAANLTLGRFFKYFEVYLCCFIPNVIELFGKKKLLIYYWCYILLWFPYLICLSRNLAGVVPYSLI